MRSDTFSLHLCRIEDGFSMHAAWVAGQRHRLEILCPPRRESGREKRSPFRLLRLPSQRCFPDPGSRRPIPVSTPCVLNGPPVPCVTAARGRSKTRARESFRRTCDRLAGYPAEISWSGRHPPPSTVAWPTSSVAAKKYPKKPFRGVLRVRKRIKTAHPL